MARILLNLTESSRRRVFGQGEALGRLFVLGEVFSFDPQKDDPSTFPGLLAGADVMVTSWGSRKLTPEDWPGDRGWPLLIAHGAGSVRGVVSREALARGVRVSQSAAPIAVAAAQYAVGLMILALRQAAARSAALRAGERYHGDHPFQDLDGLTVGLVGLSQIGRRVPPLLAPFGCRVLAYDPYAGAEDAAVLGVSLVADLDDLIAASDVLSLHAPLTPETEGLIDARRIGLLRPGAVFINTARAGLVDQRALFARAMAGDIQAYLDVTAPEPLPPTHEGWSSPNIFITPHIGGPTRQSLARIARHVVDEVERFLRGEPLRAEVTLDRYDSLA
jgi:phosphoglycerate dehydrogenase-like enzyme